MLVSASKPSTHIIPYYISRSFTDLEHEARDDAVEFRALVVQRLSRFADAFFARAQRTEILRGLRDDVTIEAHHDAAGAFASDVHVEEDLGENSNIFGE